jgi:hypothetical protein
MEKNRAYWSMFVPVLNLLFSKVSPSVLTNASSTADGSVTSGAKRKDSPCPQDGHSRSDKKLRYTGPSLPEVRN